MNSSRCKKLKCNRISNLRRFLRNKSIRQKTQESIKIITKTKMKKLKCLRRPRNNFNKMMTIPIVKLRKPKIKNSRKILIAMRQMMKVKVRRRTRRKHLQKSKIKTMAPVLKSNLYLLKPRSKSKRRRNTINIKSHLKKRRSLKNNKLKKVVQISHRTSIRFKIYTKRNPTQPKILQNNQI